MRRFWRLDTRSSRVGLPPTRTVIRYHKTNRSNTAIRDQRFKSLCDVRDWLGGNSGQRDSPVRVCLRVRSATRAPMLAAAPFGLVRVTEGKEDNLPLTKAVRARTLQPEENRPNNPRFGPVHLHKFSPGYPGRSENNSQRDTPGALICKCRCS